MIAVGKKTEEETCSGPETRAIRKKRRVIQQDDPGLDVGVNKRRSGG